MSKRQPVAEIGAEDYRIVRHTHDVELARKLMHAEIDREHRETYGEPWSGGSEDVGKPRQAWMRVVPCLPNSYGASEGWAFQYQDAEPHARGAFPAVVFR